MIDYHVIATQFKGRIGRGDCGERCTGPHGCCNPGQWHPLAPGEGAFLADHGFAVAYNAALGVDVFPCDGRQDCPGALRPVVCRQFPLSPSRVGLMVHRACPEYRWVSLDFVVEIERMWGYLLSFGADVALWATKLEEATWSKEDRVPLWSVRREFGREYTERFGEHFRVGLRERAFERGWLEAGDKVLDVGGGRGDGARRLRELGVDAVSVDVNPELVGSGESVLGDARHLEFEGGSFDAVLCADVLEHLEEHGQALAEMLRVSRGRVVVYVTALEDGLNVLTDPTHRVFLPFAMWLEVFSRQADVLDVDWGHEGVLLGKRAGGRSVAV